MSYCTYSDDSAFHWRTSLSVERQKEIAKWVQSLPADKQKMIEEMLDDARHHEYENATADESM